MTIDDEPMTPPPPADPRDPADPTDPAARLDDRPVEATASDDDIAEDGPPVAEFPSIGKRFGDWVGRTVDRFGADPGKCFEAAVSLVAVALATGLVLAALHPTQLFSDTTATGGDMGSHLWGPRYLLDHLLPHFRLSGWTPDWYDGFPAYQFYMVVPSLLVVVLYVGLPWYLCIPALAGCVALGLLGWMKERLYRYRLALVALAGFLAVLVIPLSYNRSFKLVTALGLLGLPAACWLCAKLSDLPFPAPPIAAGAALIVIFNRNPLASDTGNIIGGNFQSTMAGEFAFSISLTFAVLYLGVAVRGLRTGRHRALAAVLFALACLCHLIPAFFVLGCTAALFLVHPDRRRLKWLLTVAPVAALLTAFWIVPFFLRKDYVNDMGWEKLPTPTSDPSSYWYYLWPKGLWWLYVMAIVGFVISVIRRRNLGLVLGIATVALGFAFRYLPQARLWNVRLLPFMYLSVAMLAALAVGELVHLAATAAAGDARRPLRVVSVIAGCFVFFGTLVYTALPLQGVKLAGVKKTAYTDPSDNTAKTRSSFLFFHTTAENPAPGWSNYNYQGLERKPASPPGCDAAGSTTACSTGGWPEFKALVQTMAGIGKDRRYGCGRAFWEYDQTRVGGYGTPMALMLLPYFTDSCIGSQEGLYFESSTTVPYHFLMQAELSAQGSGPQRDMNYPGFDIDAGVRHLQMLGVRYYLASTTTAVSAARNHPDLKEIAVSGAWHIYEVADADVVSPLTYEPVVAMGMGNDQDGWLPTAAAWFLDPQSLDVPIAIKGPSDWKRVQADPVPTDERRAVIYLRGQLGFSGAIDQVPTLPRRRLPKVEVSKVDVGRTTISFDVSKVGVPVLVKASYFPNWHVSGGKGPYRVTPNLMVVIPTSKHVELDYGRTPVDLLGIVLTLLGLAGLVWLVRSGDVEVEEQDPGRVSRWLDEIITIPPMEKQPRRGWTPPPVGIPGAVPDDPDGSADEDWGEIWSEDTPPADPGSVAPPVPPIPPPPAVLPDPADRPGDPDPPAEAD